MKHTLIQAVAYYMDNFFITLSFAKMLFTRKLTIAETVRQNKSFVSQEKTNFFLFMTVKNQIQKYLKRNVQSKNIFLLCFLMLQSLGHTSLEKFLFTFCKAFFGKI